MERAVWRHSLRFRGRLVSIYLSVIVFGGDRLWESYHLQALSDLYGVIGAPTDA